MGSFQSIAEAIPSDLLKPMLEEFRTGWNLRKVQAMAKRQLMGKLNEKHHGFVDGLGQMTMRIDPDSYHYWGLRLGYACWKDKQFVKEYLRDNPECKVNSRPTKTTLVVSGNKKIVDAYGVEIR